MLPQGGDVPVPAISAAVIARKLVGAYYKTLHESPDAVHTFYGDDANFTRLENGARFTDADVVVGQENISNRIRELGYTNCKVVIDSVDSQYSVDFNVVIMVTGALWNGSWPAPRRFSQTFFLRGQGTDDAGLPTSYYVRNDILRLTEDVLIPAPVAHPVANSVVQQQPSPAPQPSPQPDVSPRPVSPAAPSPRQQAKPLSPRPASVPSPRAAAPTPAVVAAEPVKEISQQASPSAAAPEAAQPARPESAATEGEQKAGRSKAGPKKGPIRRGNAWGTDEKKQQSNAKASPAAQSTGQSAAASPPAAPVAAATAEKPAQPAREEKQDAPAPVPPANANWATRLFPLGTSKVNAPTPNVGPVPAPAAARSHQPAAAPAATPSEDSGARPRQMNGREKQPASSPSASSASDYSTTEVFLQPPTGMQPEALKTVMSRFGEVKSVVKNKAGYFVEYSSPQGAQNAANQGSVLIDDQDVRVRFRWLSAPSGNVAGNVERGSKGASRGGFKPRGGARSAKSPAGEKHTQQTGGVARQS